MKDQELLDAVRADVLADAEPVTPRKIAESLTNTGRVLGTQGFLTTMEWITAELQGLGPLQELLNDPEVTDIFVNGVDSVWVQRGSRLLHVKQRFEHEEQIRSLAVRLIGAAGKRLDESTPCVDARLPGGVRVHAVTPPISSQGTVLSIRLKREHPFSLQELVDRESLAPETTQLLRRVIKAGLNLLITGTSGSGKTTLLNTLLGECHPAERIVLVEDTPELQPAHPHVLSLSSRAPNAEGRGEVTLSRLIRESLRMNPGRIVVGECRGAEIRELFLALNTGHSGAGTLHANSAEDVPARLAGLGALAGWSVDAVGLQAASAVEVLIHLVIRDGVRRVQQLALLKQSQGQMRVHVAAEHCDGTLRPGPAWEELQERLC